MRVCSNDGETVKPKREKKTNKMNSVGFSL